MTTPEVRPDKRRYKRVTLDLSVRFLLPDGSEHAGQVRNISAGGIGIVAQTAPEIGAPLVLYVDEIGRFEGQVVRHHENGFAVAIAMPDERRERIVDLLMMLVNRARLDGAILRRHERQPTSGGAQIILPDGDARPCTLLDLSVSGVSIAVRPVPPVGTEVTIGRMQGRVVRHHEQGCAIEFRALPRLQGSLATQLATRSAR